MNWIEYGRYEYSVDWTFTTGIGHHRHLRVRKKSGKDGISWDALMKIKGRALGEWTQAIEVYPPRGELIDHANYRHLWEIPDIIKLPSL